MSGAVYHLGVRIVSKASGGASAARLIDDYVRRGRHARGSDPALYVVSGHMPQWASGRPQTSPLDQTAARAYWSAADRYERRNGRLMKRLIVALPAARPVRAQVELSVRIANVLTRQVDGGDLPWTLAVHGGFDAQGRSRYPHCFIAISERVNDGFSRHPKLWLSRAAPRSKFGDAAARYGGAWKTRRLKSRRWLFWARAVVAQLINSALEAAGVSARVDHRSHVARALDRLQQPKTGALMSLLERLGIKRRQSEANTHVTGSAKVSSDSPAGPTRAPIWLALDRPTPFWCPTTGFVGACKTPARYQAAPLRRPESPVGPQIVQPQKPSSCMDDKESKW